MNWKPLYEMSGVEFLCYRRRYGKTTYTWVGYRSIVNGEIEELGDPWPCVVPPKREVMQAFVDKNAYRPSSREEADAIIAQLEKA